ncbi:MAG: polysaccharide pyruvyl transferase family protein [Vicinamibacteraceae bacterium]
MHGRNLYLLRFNGRNDNLGDQFIFRALMHALTDLGSVCVHNGAPAFIESAPPGHWRLGWRSALTTLRGGAVYNFLPPGGRTWRPPTQAGRAAGSWLKSLKKTSVELLAGPKVVIGTSVIPTANHSWCKDCAWIGVRDHQSLAALRAAGVASAEYFPDLSFLPAPPRPADVQRQGIRVSFRETIPEAPDPRAYTSRLSEALGALAGQLIPDERHRMSSYYQVEEDEEFMRQMSRLHDVPFGAARVTLEAFEAFYRRADLVVSNRLHGLLMGAYCGAVPVALTSREHTKVNALFTTVGWKSLLLHIEDARELPDQFAAIRQDIPSLRRMVAASFDEQRSLGLRILEQRFGGTAG